MLVQTVKLKSFKAFWNALQLHLMKIGDFTMLNSFVLVQLAWTNGSNLFGVIGFLQHEVFFQLRRVETGDRLGEFY